MIDTVCVSWHVVSTRIACLYRALHLDLSQTYLMTPAALSQRHPRPLSAMMSPVSPDDFQPLQLKGEILDLDFTLDTDHRLADIFTPSTPVNHPKIGNADEIAQLRVVSTAIHPNARCASSSSSPHTQQLIYKHSAIASVRASAAYSSAW